MVDYVWRKPARCYTYSCLLGICTRFTIRSRLKTQDRLSLSSTLSCSNVRIFDVSGNATEPSSSHARHSASECGRKTKKGGHMAAQLLVFLLKLVCLTAQECWNFQLIHCHLVFLFLLSFVLPPQLSQRRFALPTLFCPIRVKMETVSPIRGALSARSRVRIAFSRRRWAINSCSALP